MPIDEKQLQKAVEDVREKGYLDIKIRIDAKKFAGINGYYDFEKKIVEEGVLDIIFRNEFKILNAYKKKYGKK